MAKELQNRAWGCLPKEFKEEVKKLYTDALDASNSPHEPDDRKWGNYRVALLEKLFGLNLLTSDAEGEEMLTVKANLVKELYQRAKEIEEESMRTHSPLVAAKHRGVQRAIEHLFGSKCLPDGANMQKLSNLDKTGKDCNVDSLSQNPHENCDNGNRISDGNNNSHKSPDTCKCPKNVQKNNTDLGHLSQSSSNFDKQFDNIIKDGFREHNRLHVAATIAAGWLACHGMTSPETIAMDALAVADALIIEVEKTNNH